MTDNMTGSMSSGASVDESCIFCKIAAGVLPSRKVYEDDDVLAFHDIAPWAPVHFLIIPKSHILSMAQLDEHNAEHQRVMGKIMTLAPRLALEQGCQAYPEGGFRTVVNTGKHGGQEVHHLHVHVIGGPKPWKIPMVDVL